MELEQFIQWKRHNSYNEIGTIHTMKLAQSIQCHVVNPEIRDFEDPQIRIELHLILYSKSLIEGFFRFSIPQERGTHTSE